MRARTIAIADADDALVDAWRDLATRSEPNPFFEPDLVLAAARHLAGGGAVALLLVEHDGHLVFLAPVQRLNRYRRLPVRTLSTWVHEYCFLGTPLLDADHPEAAEVASAHARHSGPEQWWVLPLVAADGAFADRLSCTKPAPLVVHTQARAVLRRRERLDYADGRISGRHLKNLRRQQRHLARDLGRDVLVHDAAAAEGMPLAAALEETLRIEATGWKGERRTAMLCRPGDAEFFRELCHGFAARDRLQLLIYGTDERAAAGLCNLLSGRAGFSFKIAYDAALARHSPGSYLDMAMIGIFHEDDRLDLLDSCTVPGTSPSDQLYPDRRPLVDLLVPSAGPLSRLTSRVAAPALRRAAGRRPAGDH